MASKTTATKSKSTTTNDKEPTITTIHTATCKSLNGTATLGYHIGLDETSAIHWKIDANSGNGLFSREWVAFTDIQQALDKWRKDHPIVSMALYPLFSGKSVNTPSFLLACLVNEGLLEKVPGKHRHYQFGDAKAFTAKVEKWKAQHSTPAKAKPKAKAKAGAGMAKRKATSSATSKAGND